MAQVVPNLTSLPIDSTAAPSVEDIQARLPSICVDYLSHDWAEEDVWASWRSMTRHKNEIANGVRLENASWRTWWKQRNKLKTISPETLNWLKDSDVTWLYGPLHTAVEPVPPPKVATAEERLGLNRADSATSHRHGDLQPTKPILKHRTLSEMLSIPNPSSPILEAVRAEEVDDHDLDESRPILLHTKSDTNIVTKGHHQRRKSPPRGPISSGNRTPVSGPSSSGSRTPTGEGGAAVGGAGAGLGGNAPLSPPLQQQPSKKHISFNTFVEQCIAVDDPDDIAGIEGHARDEAGLDDRHDDGEDLDDDDEDDDDEDAMLEMKSVSSANSSSARSNRSNSTRSSRPSLSRHGSQASSQPDHMTIAKIAPTTLKTLGDFPSPSPQLAYAPTGDYAEPRSPAASAAADEQDQTDQVVAFKNQAAGGYPVAIDQGGRDSSVSPNSVGSPTWDDEDDYAVGFDYFSGPDLGVGDEYDTAKRGPAASAAAAAAAAGSGTNPTRTVQSHVGNAGHYGKAGSGSAATAAQQPPVVGQVPAQPKWRSGSASSSGATTSSGSGNTSGAGSPASTAKPSPGSQSPTSPDFANISSPPQPGRSILKIRPPGSQQAYYEPETSPTNSHFNWKPSAATGQGGLESGVRRVIKEPVAGSLPSYDVNDSYFVQSGGGGAGNETPPLQSAIASAVPVAPTSPGVIGRESGGGGESRGRSAVRTGANIAERSASRSATGASGGSTAATTSISPSSSRTAVQVPISAAKSSSLAANKSESSSNSSSTPKSPPLANETPSAPQVQRPVGLGGVMPKDDVDMKREQRAKEQEERSEGVDDRTAEYVPDRGSTPTPHSSPQVAIRPLVDTSPASLPHAQTVHVAGKKQASVGGVSAAEQSASTLKAQNSVTLGGVRRHQRGASTGSTSGGNSSLGSGFFKSTLSQQQTPPAEEDSGLISNITTTARDLFGALWTYGGQTSGSNAPGNLSREPSSKEETPES